MDTNKPCPMARMSVDEMIKRLSAVYSAIIRAKIPLQTMPAVMLWSFPGIGKSQGVRQLAEDLTRQVGKKTVITDVRLLLFNPVDLRGIPVANDKKTLAVWLKPKIFDMDPGEGILNILFLDEISAAPPSVQAAAYQMTLDRAVGEHKLPDNCLVMAAGNRASDHSVAYRMPLALANRLCHIEIAPDIDSWRRWGVANGIHEKVLGYLAMRPDRLLAFDANSDALAFPTPRTWEMASRLLFTLSGDDDTAFSLLSGCLGTGTATEFRAYCSLYSKLPPIEDIFAGLCRTYPKKPDEIYALISAMTAHARYHKDDLAAVAHSVTYALKLPPDFTFILFCDYLALDEDYKAKLLNMSGFAQWLTKNERLL